MATDTELLTKALNDEAAWGRVAEIADWIERDRKEPDKVLCHVQSLRRAARASGLPYIGPSK